MRPVIGYQYLNESVRKVVQVKLVSDKKTYLVSQILDNNIMGRKSYYYGDSKNLRYFQTNFY